jgi:hypothetical protein
MKKPNYEDEYRRLRLEFIKAAMEGLLATEQETEVWTPEALTKRSIMMADAVLKAAWHSGFE